MTQFKTGDIVYTSGSYGNFAHSYVALLPNGKHLVLYVDLSREASPFDEDYEDKEYYEVNEVYTPEQQEGIKAQRELQRKQQELEFHKKKWTALQEAINDLKYKE